MKLGRFCPFAVVFFFSEETRSNPQLGPDRLAKIVTSRSQASPFHSAGKLGAPKRPPRGSIRFLDR